MDTLSVNVNYTASGSVVNTVRIDSTVSIYHVLSDGSKVLVWQGRRQKADHDYRRNS
jgi:hypothetical protein